MAECSASSVEMWLDGDSMGRCSRSRDRRRLRGAARGGERVLQCQSRWNQRRVDTLQCAMSLCLAKLKAKSPGEPLENNLGTIHLDSRV